jgi:hypothetical protein
MGGDTNITQPAQPTYGEGMEDAMLSQMEQLLGQGKYADIYKKAGFEGGNLGDILTGVEAPIRKATAQIDTDVMRQTLLGGETSATYEDDGRIIEGYETKGGNQQDTYRLEEWVDGTKGVEGYRLVNKKGETVLNTTTQPRDGKFRRDLADKFKETAIAEGYIRDEQQWTDILKADDSAGYVINPKSGELEKSQPVYKKNEDGTDFKAEPGTFEAGPVVVRAGDGMVDLVGDSRAVQEQTRSEDYAQYVKDNTDLQDDFNAKRQAGDQRTIEEYGRDHYEADGKAEGRDLPMGEYSLQDAGRQAGFDKSNKFMGLSALAEDIGRGGQQRAREADISDVERLGGRATEAYRAQGDLSGALAEARAMGAGGSDKLSAIPADPLFDGVATNSLADRTALENANINAITGGRTGDYDPRALPPSNTSYSFQNPQGQGSAGGGGGGGGSGGGAGSGMQTQGQQAQQYAQPGGTDAFRSALMQQGMGALDQGLSERENRAVQEAARARSTNMGRTFDQTASIDESRAVIEEDNARRMQNRAFAQSALGQEVGIQQADMARGLQAQQMELGRQSAGVDRQLTAEEKDIERIMRQQAMEEQYRQQGLGAERANAAQMVGLEQATSADPFQAILQRQGQNNLASGGAVFGQAGYGLDSGPQYLNPESGLGFIQNQATNAANMYNAQVGADATRSAGMWSGLGALGGGLLTGGVGTAAGKGLKSLLANRR